MENHPGGGVSVEDEAEEAGLDDSVVLELYGEEDGL